MKVFIFVVLLLCVGVSRSAKNKLSPYTLINTAIECESEDECYAYYNDSWCYSAVRCLRRYCRLIPNMPCASTQRCLEDEKRCEERACTVDSECDNGLFCDGTEVCRENKCVTDPERPNCYYKGGRCNETLKECMQPKARVAWRKVAEKERTLLSLGTAMMTTNTSIVTDLQVYEAALIVIGAFVFVVTLLAIIYNVSRSILMSKTLLKPKRVIS